MFGFNPRKHPSLPQQDSAKQREERKQRLEETRNEYIWDDAVPNVAGVPMSKLLPDDDKPTIAWYLKVIDVALQIVENAIANFVDDDSDDYHEWQSIRSRLSTIKAEQQERENADDDSWLEDSLKTARAALSISVGSADEELTRLRHLVEKYIPKWEPEVTHELESYQGLFETIELDPVAREFQNDEVFAYYRVGGPNPMLIECIQQIPANFHVTEEGFQSVLPDDSLVDALNENRLFVSDYKELQNIVDHPGDYKGLKKQLFAPIALFVRPKQKGSLIPVAIQRTQKSEEYETLYAVTDPDHVNYWPWQTAKSIVQMADGNYHELFVHLARTHLMIEAFVVATRRQLADTHPINILLLPHFEGTLSINKSAASSLIAEGGQIDHLFAGKIEVTQKSAGADRLAYDFYANMLPENLKRRGLSDPEVLPDYPYRDDGLSVWRAIHQWVTDYCGVYYTNEGELVEDYELAAWCDALINEGKVVGFKPIKSIEQLVDVLTMVIFTASAQHAAVNFPQGSLMTYAPAITGALWGPTNPAGNNEQEWLATLVPMKLASEQLNFLHLLGGVYYRPLGDYCTNDFPYREWFKDPNITGEGKALAKFQQQLKVVEQEINQRNNNRSLIYSYLLPSRIPQSINI
ncbi:lipoxygenase family protein [Pleionea sp. CnH1-48]|uniref:lipoxygenase family protein n=1 Tax=Pleionea sp. CnH1-48 TaxID=2954494 RepID=UPI002096DAB9|nr:lipoxygenase family protein [Pleionea sp. CnH1-48]MCO7224236.1 hypothetical protein [Pleionea sp. CnH1-48]